MLPRNSIRSHVAGSVAIRNTTMKASSMRITGCDPCPSGEVWRGSLIRSATQVASDVLPRRCGQRQRLDVDALVVAVEPRPVGGRVERPAEHAEAEHRDAERPQVAAVGGAGEERRR